MSKSQKLQNILETLEAAAARKRFRRIDYFVPYDKQQQFFDLGSNHRERLFMAGNQLGKTEGGAAETAYHLTGEYPEDWLGRRFDHPVTAWAAGETSLVVRDVQQNKLCGKPGVPEEFGTGLIPKECFSGSPSLSRGVTDAYDTIQVTHKTNGIVDGISTLSFKSYEQGQRKFQGSTLDFVWLDEEPDLDIYSECLTRVTATKGMVYMTFTPLRGMSEVVERFLSEPSPDRAVVVMVIEDAKHIPEEERARIIAGYPAHERDARTRGIPMLGSGRIFPYADEMIAEPAIEHIPTYWVKLWGIDFGIGHPFGAALILWDKDNDVIHVHHTIRVKDQLPINHAAAMKPIGRNVPVAWPQDGTSREKGTGETLATSYKKQGLRMLPDHATWPDGGISTEAGILEMQDRITTGRFKVAAQLSEFFEEFRLYHRKDGVIVKLRDDILSACRIAIMAKRHAAVVQLGGHVRRTGRDEVAADVDFDLF